MPPPQTDSLIVRIKQSLHLHAPKLLDDGTRVAGVSMIALLAAGAALPLITEGFSSATLITMLGGVGGNALASWLQSWAERATSESKQDEGQLLAQLAADLETQIVTNANLADAVAVLLQQTDALPTSFAALEKNGTAQTRLLQLLLEDVQESRVRGERLQNFVLDTMLAQTERLAQTVQQGSAHIQEQLAALRTDVNQPRSIRATGSVHAQTIIGGEVTGIKIGELVLGPKIVLGDGMVLDVPALLRAALETTLPTALTPALDGALTRLATTVLGGLRNERTYSTTTTDVQVAELLQLLVGHEGLTGVLTLAVPDHQRILVQLDGETGNARQPITIHLHLSSTTTADQEPLPTVPTVTLPDLFPPAQYRIGHIDELDYLLSCYTRIENKGPGEIIFLAGVPGIGRRALAHDAARFAKERDGAVLWLRFWPTAGIDADAIATLDDEDTLINSTISTVEAAVAERWPAAARTAGPTWTRLMAQACTVIGGVPPAADSRIPTTPEDALRWALRAAARRRAIMIVLEGLEDGPELWTNLLAYLAPEIQQELQVLVVATIGVVLAQSQPHGAASTQQLSSALASRGEATVLTLEPVEQEDVAAFIAPAHPELAQRLCEMTEGLPTLIESLWREWHDTEAVIWDEDDEQWIASGDATWVYGDTRDWANRLLDFYLPQEALFSREQVEAILRCAALEGPVFTVQAVARVLELDPEAVLDFCDDYLLPTDEAPGILEEVGFVSMPEGLASMQRLNRYKFAAPIYWHIWHKYGLPSSRRADAQYRLAEALEVCYALVIEQVTDRITGLFQASGHPERAERYERWQSATTSLEALYWDVRILERLPLDGFARYRLYEARIRLSHKLFDRARYEEGLIQAQEALQLAAALDRSYEARALDQVGSNYHGLGDYEAARSFYERALATHEKVFGSTHIHMASTFYNLGQVYKNQGKYELAYPLLEQALTICKQVLGPTHPNAVLVLNSLADLYKYQGSYKLARPLLEHALAICEQMLAPANLHTAITLLNLGEVYKDQEEYKLARPLLERALGIYEQTLGSTHPDTTVSLNVLGGLYEVQGEYKLARPLLERALTICEQVLDPNHPHMATSLDNLGRLYRAQGQYELARPLLERALAIREQVLGPIHIRTAASLHNLARLHVDQGNYVAARPFYERALAIREQVLGSDHPDTQRTRQSLLDIDQKNE